LLIQNNNNSYLPDYAVNFTINTSELINAGKLHETCWDIRISDENGTIFPHYLEYGCNSSIAKIWTKVNLSNGGNSTYYINYGSSDPVDASNGTNVFHFFDNFEDGDVSDWTDQNEPIIANSTSPAMGNYSFHVRNDGISDSAGAYIVFPNITGGAAISWHSRTNNIALYSAYFRVTNQVWQEIMWTYARGTGDWSFLNSGHNLVVDPTLADTWYHLEMKDINFTSQTVDAWANGTKMFDDIAFRNGITNIDRIMVYGWNAGTEQWYDDIIVRNYVEDEPTVVTEDVYGASVITNSSGGYNLTFPVEEYYGIYPVKVNLTYNGIYAEANINLTVNGTSYMELDTPANGSFTKEYNYTFECTAYGNPYVNISNVSLYWDYNGTWHSNMSLNFTTQNATAIFNVSMPSTQENINWTCWANDTSGYSYFADENRTFAVRRLSLTEFLVPTVTGIGANASVWGTLSYSNGTGISNGTIYATLNGETLEYHSDNTHRMSKYWFHPDWEYRAEFNISTGYTKRGNGTRVKAVFNFSEILGQTVGIDQDSIRVTNSTNHEIKSEALRWLSNDRAMIEIEIERMLAKESEYTYNVYFNLNDSSMTAASYDMQDDFFLCAGHDDYKPHVYLWTTGIRSIDPSYYYFLTSNLP